MRPLTRKSFSDQHSAYSNRCPQVVNFSIGTFSLNPSSNKSTLRPIVKILRRDLRRFSTHHEAMPAVSFLLTAESSPSQHLFSTCSMFFVLRNHLLVDSYRPIAP